MEVMIQNITGNITTDYILGIQTIEEGGKAVKSSSTFSKYTQNIVYDLLKNYETRELKKGSHYLVQFLIQNYLSDFLYKAFFL